MSKIFQIVLFHCVLNFITHAPGTKPNIMLSQSNLSIQKKLFYPKYLCFIIFIVFGINGITAQKKVDIDGTLKVLTTLSSGSIQLGGPSGEIRLTPYYGNPALGATNLLGYIDGKDQGAPQLRFSSNAHNFIDFGMDGTGAFVVENADLAILKIDALGNAVIGKQAPQAFGYTLSVGGKIASEEILVDLKADWPDYVFKKEYELPTLTEVANHIKSKGHLSGLPAAADVQDKGIELGEMNRVLVEKIEELTLYILQQETRIKALEEKVSTIK